MSKRSASSDLNQDNWQHKEESEEAGVFKMASHNELKMRTIKRAKRRGGLLESNDDAPSIFKDFKAFSSTKFDSSAPPAFNFLSNNNDTPTLQVSKPFPSFSFGNSSQSSPKNSESNDNVIPNGTSNINIFSASMSPLNKDKQNKSPSLNSNKVNSSDASGIKFGITNNSTSSSTFSAFNFNPQKDTSLEKHNFSFGVPTSTASGSGIPFSKSAENNEKIFTFSTSTTSAGGSNTPFSKSGEINEKEKDKSLFKFGSSVIASNEITKPSSPKFNFSPVMEKRIEPSFKFGANSGESSPNKSCVKFVENSLDSPKLTNNISECSNTISHSNLHISASSSSSNSSNDSSSRGKFLADLKALNRDFVAWIKENLEENEYINLSPILEDYKKYFDEINGKNISIPKCDVISSQNSSNGNDIPKNGLNLSSSKPTIASPNTHPSSISKLLTTSESTLATKSSPLKSVTSFTGNSEKVTSPFSGSTTSSNITTTTSGKDEISSTKNSSATFSFGNENSASLTFGFNNEKEKPSFGSSNNSKPTFTFGSTTDNSKSTFNFGSGSPSKSTFSFGSNKENSKLTFSFGSNEKTNASTGFSFGNSNSSSGFTFTPSNNNSPSKSLGDSSTHVQNGEESEEPPKVEVNEVKEDDAIYEKRVKLFYKKEDKYVDKGVGTLFLKPAGEKFQLVVRAHTNLGNILLNILLNESLPTQKMGKNNVLLVCVPNPPIDSNTGPVSFLIRVKTSVDADELLKQIDDHKK